MVNPRKPKYVPNISNPLPKIIPIEKISKRLDIIFPITFPDRSILVGQLAARVMYVFIYGGFIEGSERFIRPSHIYLFTDRQESLTSSEERIKWIQNAHKNGFRAEGNRWYADTSKEQIRDDLMRNQLLRLGIMRKLELIDHSHTSSRPINYLDNEFAKLMDADLLEPDFIVKAELWRNTHLNSATLQRMALRASGAQSKQSDIYVNMPDGTKIRIASGPSNEIVKALIEEFAITHLKQPVVLWISASDKKSYPQFVQLAESVGLKFDLKDELPDLILADIATNVKFIMCEIVATDGAVTEQRKTALLEIIKSSNIPENSVQFLTAFEDRESQPFRKNFSQLALNSVVWFRTEPDLIVILTTERDALP